MKSYIQQAQSDVAFEALIDPLQDDGAKQMTVSFRLTSLDAIDCGCAGHWPAWQSPFSILGGHPSIYHTTDLISNIDSIIFQCSQLSS